MHAVIVVYSRTGNTLKVAKALAGTLGAEIAEIRCRRNYEGAVGFLRGALDSLWRRKPPIEVAAAAAKPHDLVVLAGPIWTGRAAPPLMAFLAGRPKLPGRVALLLTHGGSDPAKAFAEVEALVGMPLAARLALKQADINEDRFTASLADFAGKVASEMEAHLIGKTNASNNIGPHSAAK